jgi:hypothetical protein
VAVFSNPSKALEPLKPLKHFKTSKSSKLAGLCQHLQKLKIGQACVPAPVHTLQQAALAKWTAAVALASFASS